MSNSAILKAVLADRFSYSAENCSIHRSLEIVGERWTLLVLREAFYGVRRFEDFVRVLGCPRDALSARLKNARRRGHHAARALPRARQAPPRGVPADREGPGAVPALLALFQWGDRWTADPSGPRSS